MRLLLVEDEPDLATPLAQGLRRQGYAVDVAVDGVQGGEMLDVETYDVAVIDLGLPGLDGLDLIRAAREQQLALPILILTARGRPDERVQGLDLGADDYMTKPFYFEELCARLRSLLRRDFATRDPLLRCGDLTLDPARRAARQADQPLHLSKKEFALLQYLMRHPGEVVSQEELLDHVWDAQVNPLTNVVAVYVAALRRALRDDARRPHYIRTVVGEGYQLLDGAESAGGDSD